MKKILAIVLALVMALMCFASCGTEETSSPAPSAGDNNNTASTAEKKFNGTTVTDGKLTVATSPDFAPYEFYTVDDAGNYQLAGFDMALADYIAKYLGLELEVVPMDFDGVLVELAAKTVDLGMAGLSPDPTRVDKMDFSDIYYEGGQSFVTVKSNKSMFTDINSTNNKDFKIGAQNGSIQMDLAKKYSSKSDIVSLVKVTDIIAELLAGTLDGAYIETAVAESYKINYPDLEIVCNVPYEAEGSSVGVSKGNAELLKGVNEAIAAAKADGSMDKFVAEANEKSAGNIHEGLIEQ